MWHCTLVSSTPSQSIGLLFLVCVVLALSVIRCSSYYFLDRILFHQHANIIGKFYGHSLLFEIHFRLTVTKCFCLCKRTTPKMFPPMDIRLEYWIGHVTFELFYVMFTFPTRIFYILSFYIDVALTLSIIMAVMIRYFLGSQKWPASRYIIEVNPSW